MDRFDIEIIPGTTYRCAFELFTQTDGELVPDELDGIYECTIRDDARQLSQTYSLDVDAPYIRLHLTPGMTSQFFPHRRYYHAIDKTEPSGDVVRILDGRVRVHHG